MPIVSIGGGLVYFAHVPKAGGTSVEQYMEKRFGPLAFFDNQFTSWPEDTCWSKSSPQHLDRLGLSRLFPDGFFRAKFTVVRHPVSRLRSAYLFQRDGARCIPAQMSFWDWLNSLPQAQAQDPFYLDNHTRPMDDIVPQDCTVFKMEQGLDAVVDWLDLQAGLGADPGAAVGAEASPETGPEADAQWRVIPVKNNFKTRMAFQGRTSAPVTTTDADRALVGRLYAQDFDRFGYRAEDEKEGYL